MNIGISIAGVVDFDLNEFNDINKIDLWIAVDGGYDHLIKQNINCNTLIGDLDSITSMIEDNVNIIKLNPVKAETDFELAITYANDTFDQPNIYVVGVVGNDRFEHFYANIMMLRTNVELHTKNTIFKLIEGPTELEIKYTTNYQFISFFAKEEVVNLSIKDAKYELLDYHLIPSDIRCISNEFIDKNIKVAITSGSLMIVISGEHYKEMVI